jgi:hypothetical protein
MKSFCLRLAPDLYDTLKKCQAVSRRSLQNEIVVLIERGIESIADEEKRKNGGARKPRRLSKENAPFRSKVSIPDSEVGCKRQTGGQSQR